MRRLLPQSLRETATPTQRLAQPQKYSSAKLAELVGNLANVGYGVVSGGAAAVDALEKIMAGFEW